MGDEGDRSKMCETACDLAMDRHIHSSNVVRNAQVKKFMVNSTASKGRFAE